MKRVYRYHRFDIEVGVEADEERGRPPADTHTRYVAVVRITPPDAPYAIFSPLRLGETRGKLFGNQFDALTGGHDAGRRIVDDLLKEPGTSLTTER